MTTIVFTFFVDRYSEYICTWLCNVNLDAITSGVIYFGNYVELNDGTATDVRQVYISFECGR